MTECIVLSNKTLSDIAQWQRAIDATLYAFDLDTPIPFESFDGHLSIKWRRHRFDRSPIKTRFDCRHIPVAEVYADAAFRTPSEAYSSALAIGWDGDPFSKYTAEIAAAAYASATDGLVLLRNSDPIHPDDLIARLRSDLRFEGLPLREPDALVESYGRQTRSYRYDERPHTVIQNVGSTNLHLLKSARYGVLVGKNNSGKSFVLKALTEHWGKSASYLGPVRYQNFNLLSQYTPTENKKEERWQQFYSQWGNDSQNLDNSPINLQQAIAELTNNQRSDLREIAKKMLGVEMEFCFTVANSDMSQKYVSCNGHNISFSSSGLRLIITIITSLLDDTYSTVLIDEPELGISPEAQGLLADFLGDPNNRTRYFPHIQTLILATHSTVFLDRQDVRNNYLVQKAGDVIGVRQVTGQQDFNNIHFFLLGNRFETLYLPTAIFIVEGKTDKAFIERVLAVRYPTQTFSVIAGNGDNQIKRYVHIAKELLNGIQRSPYHNRIFVVIDAKHSAGLPAEVAEMGVLSDNIVTWPKNGIEYVYPDEIVDDIFGRGLEIAIAGDVISRNGHSISKNELAEKVCARIRPETKMNPLFQSKLLDRLDAIIG
jgi:ABC-type uncharacterized transport system ATPase subunit